MDVWCLEYLISLLCFFSQGQIMWHCLCSGKLLVTGLFEVFIICDCDVTFFELLYRSYKKNEPSHSLNLSLSQVTHCLFTVMFSSCFNFSKLLCSSYNLLHEYKAIWFEHVTVTITITL